MSSVAHPPIKLGLPSVNFDTSPAGERYFRHPGDVVRLVLWGTGVFVLALLVAVGTSTSDGVTTDLGRVAARLALSIRQLVLALTQVVAVVVPAVVAVGLVVRQRWRRLGVVTAAAVLGAGAWLGLERGLDLPGRLADAVTTGTWVASPRFPSLAYLAGATAAGMVGKPWLSRSWRRAADIGVLVLATVMAVAGSAGVPELLLAVCTGAAIGAALLVVVGAPNRRPSPAAVAAALGDAGFDVAGLELRRAQGGRAQLYFAESTTGERAFLKVYGRDSRDADLLYRGYRALLLRGPNDRWPSSSLKQDVEHEAFLLLLARQGGVVSPDVELLAALPDGSVVLTMEYIDGDPLDALPPDDIDDRVLDATWRDVAVLHHHRLAHRALRAGNILVDDHRPVIVDFGFAEESATARMQALDRAELLTSLAELVGPERAVAAAAREIDRADLSTALPFLQPLGLSAATRKRASKSLLTDLRSALAAVTGTEPVPLERLVRVKPRTLLTIAALVGAFYVFLPQLANVGDSFRALRSANWGWLVVAALLSGLTYVASAVGLSGGVPEHLPPIPTVEVQLASSFVNRVTPANVGGMALNVRFLRKAGVDPAEAVTGVGLNSIAGAIVHLVLLVLFFAWAGQAKEGGFSIPAGSKVLIAIAAVLAVAGVVAATRRGRRLLRTHVVGFLKRSVASMATLARSPLKMAALFGGSAGVTLAYISALAASVAAFHGGVTVAEVGAVYLGSSMIAAAAPTPGGLGALEAALVAGFTGVGMEPGVAVAAVLAYRLVTYWLPVLPGWFCFHLLERRDLI
ncbi:MAG: hypothetical protein JWN29_4059 [Acidimicrobiales bacterium]|nr:hypothetical protein [Acidimicrobiales bacterium]